MAEQMFWTFVVLDVLVILAAIQTASKGRKFSPAMQAIDAFAFWGTGATIIWWIWS